MGKKIEGKTFTAGLVIEGKKEALQTMAVQISGILTSVKATGFSDSVAIAAIQALTSVVEKDMSITVTNCVFNMDKQLKK